MSDLAPSHWVDDNVPAGGVPPKRGRLAAVAAIADVLFATAAGPPPPERLAWLCDRIDAAFGNSASVGSRILWRLMLWAVCTVAPLMVFRPWPLRWMNHEVRARALTRVERTPVAMALFAVKALLAIQYYEHPESARDAGFDGACLGAEEVTS